ncbi:helix-turn-helix domain-containing protein, partial [Bacillus cereus group sp. BfR-BA-01347]|uniref:helix-turn-helix domain-containing protein n=1 Tax=Bacillus cereus group sp. BfR-BA-01347 TaxID=2920310 RepID=UPI001F5A8557
YTFYPAQYKLDVLYYMNEHGTSIRETAALFNIPSYETGGLDALQSKKKGRPTMKDKKIKPVDEGSIEALQ